VKNPFLVVNPKSYLYGKKILQLAESTDKIAEKSRLQIFFTCPFTDIRYIREHTHFIIVTAQHMEYLKPGRGMGHILPESLQEAGAGAVFLNHAENPLTVSQLSKTIIRAKKLGLITIVCADSLLEATAIAEFKPDILLCEPTDLIGTGQVADDSYILKTTEQIKSINPDIAVMIASGITTAEDVYNVIKLGADGTGGTSGILKAPDPVRRVQEMAEAVLQAQRDRKNVTGRQ
jgi:triosephosphate isomerase